MEIIETLKNLLSRDADCRCGNMRLDEKEIKAIKDSIELFEKRKQFMDNMLEEKEQSGQSI